jgi:flagellar biosynthesis anti-sigma factor FlgM
MVNKINNIPGAQPAGAFGSLGTLAQPQTEIQQKPETQKETTPAAALEISDIAKAGRLAQESFATDSFDAALVQEIRQRIDSGQFEMRFEEVAQGILSNAVALSQSRSR